MKRSRRIEITTFRRRTSLILRYNPEGSRINTQNLGEATKKDGAVEPDLTPIQNATIKQRRDDHECKDNSS